MSVFPFQEKKADKVNGTGRFPHYEKPIWY